MAELPDFMRQSLRKATRRVAEEIPLPADYVHLTKSQRVKVRLQYAVLQNNLCYYCKHDLDGPPSEHVVGLPLNEARFPPGFFENPHHLHHCHRTGLTFGTVHARCNAVLWEYHNE